MSVNYTKQTWADNDATKPVSAARMGHFEDGIDAVDTAAIAAAAAAQSAAVAAAATDATTKAGAAQSAAIASAATDATTKANAAQAAAIAAAATDATTKVAGEATARTTAIAAAIAGLDDVLGYANLAAFPATGTTGTIYEAFDTNFLYRWSGSSYVQVGGGAASDATTGAKGIVQLAGDLAGTAAAPIVPGLVLKQSLLPPMAVATTATALTAARSQPFNATTGPIAVPALPALSGLATGTTYGVEKTDSSTNAVTITFGAGDTSQSGATGTSLLYQGALALVVVDSPAGGGAKFWKGANHIRGDATITTAAVTAVQTKVNPVGLTSPVVGTRPPSAYTGSGSGNVGFNGRLKDVLAVDCSDLRLVYSSPLAIDNAGPGNAVQVEAGIEVTIGGGEIPVTFRGRTYGIYDSDGLCVSDPIAGFYPKGTPIWTRSFKYTETSVCGTWTTVSGSTTATLANLAAYAFGKGKLTVGAIIFGAGITGFTTTVTAISLDQLTITLSAAASSSATGTFYSNAGQADVTHSGYIGASEYGGAPTGTSPNLSKSGTITSATGNTTGPTLILADRTYSGRPPCVLLIGDSLTAGTGWTATDYPSRAGTSYATIGMSAGGLAGSSTALYDTPYINLGKPSETAATYAAAASSYRRRKLWGFGTHATCLYGINDLGAGSTMTQIQASLVAIWNDLARAGIKVWACTLGPKNNSSDSFTTQGGLSKTYTVTVEGYRTGINDWIRDGAPILAGVAAAAGSSAAGTLRTGAAGHPLTGYFETADQWETSRNSGIWQIALVYPTDGLGVHPNNAGHVAGATAINRALFV